LVVTTSSEEQTADVARQLAASLDAGAVVLLQGTLGAGKTAFVRGLAEGLGIDPELVSSPTFTLLQEYRGGRLTLHHADLYRLDRADLSEFGLDAREIEAGVLAIEWPERLVHPIPGAIPVALIVIDDQTRQITVGTAGWPRGQSDDSASISPTPRR
jgi:tRNA threonylcarbamoyladenosine biosynthesis protein TsaE